MKRSEFGSRSAFRRAMFHGRARPWACFGVLGTVMTSSLAFAESYKVVDMGRPGGKAYAVGPDGEQYDPLRKGDILPARTTLTLEGRGTWAKVEEEPGPGVRVYRTRQMAGTEEWHGEFRLAWGANCWIRMGSVLFDFFDLLGPGGKASQFMCFFGIEGKRVRFGTGTTRFLVRVNTREAEIQVSKGRVTVDSLGGLTWGSRICLISAGESSRLSQGAVTCPIFVRAPDELLADKLSTPIEPSVVPPIEGPSAAFTPGSLAILAGTVLVGVMTAVTVVMTQKDYGTVKVVVKR